MADDHGSVIVLTSSEQWEKLHKENPSTPIIVDFTAVWCGPCKFIAPHFAKLSTEFPSVIFVKVDVDKFEAIAASAEVSAMPTFHVYKGGKIVDKTVGASPDKLKDLVQKHAA
eukprot:TRINITY_DN20201_c0_g1_i1.p1 TRINITY_DN20201_c0_g1~~TRINITY_DN20201_c0_g1_i1.p1  ORF type:complete len:113 (+),score=28.56 TRINITY_DN20201_c0_g1_i1:123-461(+)